MEYDQKISGFFGEYRWLSNFWMVPIAFGDLVFPSAEHAYQAAKSEHRDDWVRFTHIPEPGKAKVAGRLLRMRPGWDDMKIGAMREILQVKFAHGDLREKLIATGNAELIEENHWGDSFWGYDSKRGFGQNFLGLLLMQERARIRNQPDLVKAYDVIINDRYDTWAKIPF
jgi:ribA/ribD-fused uncharacterized protein